MLSTAENDNVHYLVGFVEIMGQTIKKPQNSRDYLRLIRRFLPDNDYFSIIKGIISKLHYDTLPEQHQKIVDNFNEYRKYDGYSS